MRRNHQSPWATVDALTAIGALATIAGFTFAGWSSFVHRAPQRLAYSVTGSCSIGPTQNAASEASSVSDPNGSSVTYRGRSVAHLTATTFCILNLGTGTIRPEDFQSLTPIHIDFGDQIRVLNASVMRRRGQPLPPVTVQNDGRTVTVSAPQLSSGERIGLVVLSDSLPADAAEPVVTADLQSGRKIEQIAPIALIHPAYLTLRCLAAACLALPCLIPLLGGWLRSRRLFVAASRASREHAYMVLLASVIATMSLAAVDVWAWRWLDQITVLLDGLSRLYGGA